MRIDLSRVLFLAGVVIMTACDWNIPNPYPTPKPTPTPIDCAKLYDDAKEKCKNGEPWSEECKAAQGAYLMSPCAVTIPDPKCIAGQVFNCWHQPPNELPTYVCPVYNAEGGIIDTTSVFDPASCPVKPEPIPDPPPPPDPGPGPIVPAQPADTWLKMNNKWWGGNKVHEATVKIEGPGAKQYCADMGWTDGRQSCALAVDDDPRRSPRELAWLGKRINKPQACPVWQYSPDQNQVFPCFDDHNALASCDHFGSPGIEDDPHTPAFEGSPQVCGEQRNEFGPFAGFSVRPHSGGFGYARACLPDYTGCGPWVKVKM